MAKTVAGPRVRDDDRDGGQPIKQSHDGDRSSGERDSAKMPTPRRRSDVLTSAAWPDLEKGRCPPYVVPLTGLATGLFVALQKARIE
jgi:hypothetical protein